MNLFLTKLTIVAGQSRLLAWIRQALLFTLLSTLNSAQTLSVQKFMQLLSFCCWHLIFRHSAGATNHSCKCCFSKQIFASGYGHVVMPDLTDFFDRKVSKVSLIFAVIITSVLSAVVIFHCLSYNFTGRCCYELQGSFSTFIKKIWRLVPWPEKKSTYYATNFIQLREKLFSSGEKKNPLDDWIIPESQSTSLFRRSLYKLNLGLLCTNAMVTIAHTTPLSKVTIMPY